MEALRKAGLERFIRTKEDLNKEAMLADPEAVASIPGISVSQREEFVIVPIETALEEVL
jgi:phage host-nuclease inhibitor protein Gam